MTDDTAQAKGAAFRERLLDRGRTPAAAPEAEDGFTIPPVGRPLPMPIRTDRPEPEQGELFPVWLMHQRLFGRDRRPDAPYGPDATDFREREAARREAKFMAEHPSLPG